MSSGDCACAAEKEANKTVTIATNTGNGIDIFRFIGFSLGLRLGVPASDFTSSMRPPSKRIGGRRASRYDYPSRYGPG